MTTDNRPAETELAPEAVAPEDLAPVAAPPKPAPDFAWMRVPTQRGVKPVIGPAGLRIADIDVGSYGDVPDVWPYRNDMPRGSHPPAHIGLTASYSIFDKVEVWSDNVRTLYEDAIRDRWASATAVPWETLQPLPEHIERAICQVCTEMSEQAYLTVQILSSWLEKISYGFYEVKSFLSTQIYDSARHNEAFRKRALANGGGLGIESPGIYHRAVAAAMTFTELVMALNIVRGTYNLVVTETLKRLAASEAERTLYSLVARDLRRHVDYGVGHINYYLSRQPHLHDQVHAWLSRAEFLLVADQSRNRPFVEAFILLLGDTVEEGRAQFQELRRTWLNLYLHCLADARVYDRIGKLAPEIANYLPEGAAVPTSVSMRPPVPAPRF